MEEMYVLHDLHGETPPKEEPNWEMELAQAYVRAQPLTSIFAPEESLRKGTVFPNLSQPYKRKG